MTKVAKPLAGHELGDASGAFVIVEWEDHGGSNESAPIAPLHVHHTGEEAWYVLEGALGVRLGEETVTVPAGAAVVASRGTPHTFWNAGTGPCRYLVVMTPEIRRLITALHSPDLDRGRAALEAVFADHGSELI